MVCLKLKRYTLFVMSISCAWFRSCEVVMMNACFSILKLMKQSLQGFWRMCILYTRHVNLNGCWIEPNGLRSLSHRTCGLGPLLSYFSRPDKKVLVGLRMGRCRCIGITSIQLLSFRSRNLVAALMLWVFLETQMWHIKDGVKYFSSRKLAVWNFAL